MKWEMNYILYFHLDCFHFERRRMKHQELIQIAIPEDIAIKIASYLEAADVCALGCCSWFWRELCGSDFLWEALVRERWPLLLPSSGGSSSSPHGLSHSELDGFNQPLFQGWKGFYVNCHDEMAQRAATVVQHVEHCSYLSESLEIKDYIKAIEDLNSMKLGFKDIEMFLFTPKATALLNLVGLHYCLNWLRVPGEKVKEAVEKCKIGEREVCVRWWKLGRWLHGFRMRDESHSRQVSLQHLASSSCLPDSSRGEKSEEVLGVLQRGAIHEVLRVHISVASSPSTSWSFRP